MQQQLDVGVFLHDQLVTLAADLHLQQGAIKVAQQAGIPGVDQGAGTCGSWHGSLLLGCCQPRFAHFPPQTDLFFMPCSHVRGIGFISIAVRFWLVIAFVPA